MSETCLDTVEEYMINDCEFLDGRMSLRDIVIIDSIQTIYKENVEVAPGSISQVRKCTSSIMRIAKQKGISVLIVVVGPIIYSIER